MICIHGKLYISIKKNYKKINNFNNSNGNFYFMGVFGKIKNFIFNTKKAILKKLDDFYLLMGILLQFILKYVNIKKFLS